MLTLLLGAEPADDTSEANRAAAGVEERAGRRGVAKNGISFPSAGARKLDSLSEDLLGPNNKVGRHMKKSLSVKVVINTGHLELQQVHFGEASGMRDEMSSRCPAQV